MIDASDQRILSGFPHNPELILGHVGRERPDQFKNFTDLEMQQLIPLSLGQTAAEVGAELGFSTSYMNEQRTSAKRKVGALTLPQLVYLGMYEGYIPYEMVTLDTNPTPTAKQIQAFSMVNLGFTIYTAAPIIGGKPLTINDQLGRLCGRWEIRRAVQASRRVFELGIWHPRPIAE